MKLINNGLDSLKKAVKNLKIIPEIQDPDEKESTMKDVIIHLHHSIETLFKYIIQSINPYLVYSDVEGAFNHQFDKLIMNKPIKDEKTIEFLDAVHRVFILKNNGHDVTIDQQRYNLFFRINYERNALAHYEYEFDFDFEAHIIAGILQVLVPLYKKCLPDFDAFATQCDLYEDAQEIRNNGLYWETQRSANIYLKIKNALARKAVLDSNPEEYTNLFNSKNKDLIYSECPACGKKLFIKNSNYIIDSEHIYELGKCECCGFEYTREDAQLVTYKYTSFQELQERLNGDTLASLVEYQLIDLEDYAYKCAVDELGSIEDELYRLLSNLTYNLCIHVARQYVDREITQYNDEAEAIYKLDDITDFYDIEEEESGEGNEPVKWYSKETRHKWINMAEEIKKHGFPDDCEYHLRLEKLLKYITEIAPSMSRRIKTKLSKEDYITDCSSMFLNWDGDDVVFDVPVTVDFKASEFQKLKIPN